MKICLAEEFKEYSPDSKGQRKFRILIEGSLNGKCPTIKADEKQRDEVKSEERRCNSAKIRRKKIRLRQRLEKSRIAVFYSCVGYVVPENRKANSLVYSAKPVLQRVHSEFTAQNYFYSEFTASSQRVYSAKPVLQRVHSEFTASSQRVYSAKLVLQRVHSLFTPHDVVCSDFTKAKA